MPISMPKRCILITTNLKNGDRAVLSMGDYIKGFYGEGVNDSAPMGVMYDIEEWIRDNKDAILAKAKKQ